MATALTLTLIFLSGSWEVVWFACLAVEAGCGFIGEHVGFWVIVGVCPMGRS